MSSSGGSTGMTSPAGWIYRSLQYWPAAVQGGGGVGCSLAGEFVTRARACAYTHFSIWTLSCFFHTTIYWLLFNFVLRFFILSKVNYYEMNSYRYFIVTEISHNGHFLSNRKYHWSIPRQAYFLTRTTVCLLVVKCLVSLHMEIKNTSYLSTVYS